MRIVSNKKYLYENLLYFISIFQGNNAGSFDLIYFQRFILFVPARSSIDSGVVCSALALPQMEITKAKIQHTGFNYNISMYVYVNRFTRLDGIHRSTRFRFLDYV